MLVAFYDFLKSLYGQNNVFMSYGDQVTTPGLSCVFSEESADRESDLAGETNVITYTYNVEIWHDSYEEVLRSSQILINAVEGTDLQIQSMRPVREDGYKRKWHRVITIRIMEDF